MDQGMGQAKPQVLFVGAFRPHHRTQPAVVGGQLYACQTLVESEISRRVHWFLLDSTMAAIPPPPLPFRLAAAGRRLATIFLWLVFKKIDVVMVFSSAGASLIEKGLMIHLARAFGKRTIFSPRSGLILEDIRRSKLVKNYLAGVLRASDRILCQSSSWKAIYQDLTGLPDSRLQVIYNWMDIRPYRTGVGQHQEPPHGFLEDRPVNFLYMGWLETYKGIFDLIEAVDYCRPTLNNARFTICGEGSQSAVAKACVEEKGLAERFNFRGWVTGQEKMEVLAEADVLVIPSHREGLPNVLLEGMAFGLPVVATSVGAIPEVVNHGHTGLIVSPAEIAALGQSMALLYTDPQMRESLGRAAREYVFANHDIVRQWRRVYQIIIELMERDH